MKLRKNILNFFSNENPNYRRQLNFSSSKGSRVINKTSTEQSSAIS